MNANGGKYGAGIGGGAMGAGENITISDGAHVTANGGAQGAGIGGGSGIGGNGSNITISGDKTYVEATGGGDAEAAGAGIGGGALGTGDVTIEAMSPSKMHRAALVLPVSVAAQKQNPTPRIPETRFPSRALKPVLLTLLLQAAAF